MTYIKSSGRQEKCGPPLCHAKEDADRQIIRARCPLSEQNMPSLRRISHGGSWPREDQRPLQTSTGCSNRLFSSSLVFPT